MSSWVIKKCCSQGCKVSQQVSLPSNTSQSAAWKEAKICTRASKKGHPPQWQVLRGKGTADMSGCAGRRGKGKAWSPSHPCALWGTRHLPSPGLGQQLKPAFTGLASAGPFTVPPFWKSLTLSFIKQNMPHSAFAWGFLRIQFRYRTAGWTAPENHIQAHRTPTALLRFWAHCCLALHCRHYFFSSATNKHCERRPFKTSHIPWPPPSSLPSCNSHHHSVRCKLYCNGSSIIFQLKQPTDTNNCHVTSFLPYWLSWEKLLKTKRVARYAPCYCSLCFLYHTELKSLCTCTHTIHTCTQAAQHTQVPVLESWVHTAPRCWAPCQTPLLHSRSLAPNSNAAVLHHHRCDIIPRVLPKPTQEQLQTRVQVGEPCSGLRTLCSPLTAPSPTLQGWLCSSWEYNQIYLFTILFSFGIPPFFSSFSFYFKYAEHMSKNHNYIKR